MVISAVLPKATEKEEIFAATITIWLSIASYAFSDTGVRVIYKQCIHTEPTENP